MHYAIVIAVEHYIDAAIPDVLYAEADAKAFADALAPLGFNRADIHMLLSDAATMATIESLVGRVARSLTADDTLYLFYAGHGFSSNGANYLTCRDTNLADLVATSVRLQKVFDVLRKSKVKRVAIFLDACESGMPADLSVRSVFSHFAEHELEAFFRDAEFYVCFASCKADEKSYSSGAHKHGIWTHHLIEALSGKAPLAMTNGLVTSMTLQNYLAAEVPALRIGGPGAESASRVAVRRDGRVVVGGVYDRPWQVDEIAISHDSGKDAFVMELPP